MEPMSPLENAVHLYAARVDPPTFFDRHPRATALLRLLPWLLLTVLMVDRLRTEGFGWFVVIGLVIFAFNLGYYSAKVERPDPPD